MQTRSFEYKDDDLTTLLDKHKLGMIDYGLYRGFDALLQTDTMTLSLYHTVNGYSFTNESGVAMSNVGLIVSKQGVKITETAAVTVDIPVNNYAVPRNDLIVMEHVYTYTKGGTPASYKCIVGDQSGNLPALTNPKFQIVLGTLTVPANATNLRTSTYKKAAVPNFAGKDSGAVTLTGDQAPISGAKGFDQIYSTIGSATIANSVLVLSGNYNLYRVTQTDGTTVQTISGQAIKSGQEVEIIVSVATMNVMSNTASIVFGGVANGTVLMHPAGEIVKFRNVDGVYYCSASAEHLSGRTGIKLKGLVKYSSQSVVLTSANQSIVVQSNMLNVTTNNATNALGSLQSAILVTGTSDTGAIIKVRNAGNSGFRLLHGSSTGSAKPLTLPDGVVIVMNKNDVATFYEDTNAYVLIGYYQFATSYPLTKNMVIAWYGNISTIPYGWALCDGTNGRPNMKGRVIVGLDDTSTVASLNTLGLTGGEATHTQTIDEMPQHDHQLNGSLNNGTNSSGSMPATVYTGKEEIKRVQSDGTRTMEYTGKGVPFNIMQPYMTMYYIIKL